MESCSIYLFLLTLYLWDSSIFMRFIHIARFNFFKKILFIYFWREQKGGRKRVREISISCLSYMLNQEPSLQPRHVPWLGIQLATLHFARRRPTHWTTYFIKCFFLHLLIWSCCFYPSSGLCGVSHSWPADIVPTLHPRNKSCLNSFNLKNCILEKYKDLRIYRREKNYYKNKIFEK